MAILFRIRRGAKASLPVLTEGEPGFTTDEKKLYLGTSSGNVALASDADLSAHTSNKNNPHTVTASQVGAATRYTYTVTIPASWTGTEAPYTQTVAVAGMLATDTPVADLVQSNDWAEATAQREEYGKITRMTTGAGVLTVYATEPTTVALTVALEGVR